uniref:Uncharacterized protein n=1 Tax=Moniliophthora roreri TaxID=221103 RepID=A0A0W0FNF6_MONRR
MPKTDNSAKVSDPTEVSHGKLIGETARPTASPAVSPITFGYTNRNLLEHADGPISGADDIGTDVRRKQSATILYPHKLTLQALVSISRKITST